MPSTHVCTSLASHVYHGSEGSISKASRAPVDRTRNGLCPGSYADRGNSSRCLSVAGPCIQGIIFSPQSEHDTPHDMIPIIQSHVTPHRTELCSTHRNPTRPHILEESSCSSHVWIVRAGELPRLEPDADREARYRDHDLAP